jgi:hypothetical protein
MIVENLPQVLEKLTCTCSKRANFSRQGSHYSFEKNTMLHRCGKPYQENVIYECDGCNEYFYSTKLTPTIRIDGEWKIQSVVYIARAMTSPRIKDGTESIYDKINEVFCDDCAPHFND